MFIKIGAGVVTLAAAVVAIASAGTPSTAGPASPALRPAPRPDPSVLALTASTPHRPGPGWTVAVWSRHVASAGTLFLIDPSGHRRAVAAVPKYATPEFWSPDGKRVLLTSEAGPLQVTLATGRTSRVRLPESATELGYSRPRGLALLAAVGVTVHGEPTERIERFGLDGRHQQNYPTTVTHAGRLSTWSLIENPTGTQLVVGATRGVVVLRNDGTVVRRLLTRARDCTVASWWRRDVALAACHGTLWAAPTSGAPVTRLSAGPSRTNPFGYSTQWRYSRGRLGLAPNGCGPASLVRFRADGSGVRLEVPRPVTTTGAPVYLGHSGDRVIMKVSKGSGCMSGAATLFAYNAVTHRSTALLGPAVNGGTVHGALVYPQD